MMPMSEFIRSLFGLWRIVLIDKRGIHFFDNSYRRTMRSFCVPVICYFLMLVMLSLTRADSYEGHIPLSLALIVQSLGFVITFCGSLIVSFSIVQYLQKNKEFMRYVQVNNWFAVITFFLILPVILIGTGIDPMIEFFFFVLLFFQKIYEWFIIQTIFQIQWYWVLLILIIGEVIDTLVSAMVYITIY